MVLFSNWNLKYHDNFAKSNTVNDTFGNILEAIYISFFAVKNNCHNIEATKLSDWNIFDLLIWIAVN